MIRTLSSVAVLIGCALFALPDDVFTNSEIARQRMYRLMGAFGMYWNYHEVPPSEPHLLFPDWESDPLTFWHPGDSDPPPETIDNSVPNAPNSARISFDWPVAWDGAPDQVFIQDNTPDNNAGEFINMITLDGVVETDPPLATPTPTRMVLAQQHLRRFAIGFHFYVNDNYEWLPTDVIQMWDAGYLSSPRSFWNPGDSDPMPTDITNSELDEPNSAQVSFEYCAAGLRLMQLTPETVLLRDISDSNNGGFGIHVLWGDFRLEYIPDCPGDVTGDNRVEWTDLMVLLTNYGMTLGAYPEDGDIDGDGDVDQSDLGILLAHFEEECRALEQEEPALP